MDAKMVRAYFEQSEVYYSESKETMRTVRLMYPVHAANAASKLLREASRWSTEAGVPTTHPDLWMVTTPLFRALAARAG